MRKRVSLYFLLISAMLLSSCAGMSAQTSLGEAVEAAQASEPELDATIQPGQSLDARSETATSPAFTRATCPVTIPPDPPLIPPEPYPESPPEGHFYIGTPALWTAVPLDGSWSGLPWSGHRYSQKMVWWREGYDSSIEPEPALSLAGQRLDDAAMTFQTSKATNATAKDIGTAMMAGVEIPSAGCWQITASIQQSELSVVVWVEP